MVDMGPFKRALRVRSKVSKDRLRKGLLKGAGLLQVLSQELVPVDTGFLRESAHITDETAANGNPKVAVVYEAHYASRIHEDLEMFHWNGEAKFLEKPARTHRKRIVRLIRKGYGESK